MDWDYNVCILDISMATFVPRKLKEFNHPQLTEPQQVPYPAFPQFFNFQKSLQTNDTQHFNERQTECAQQIVGSFLF